MSATRLAITHRVRHAAAILGLVLFFVGTADLLLRYFLSARTGQLGLAGLVDHDVLRDHATRVSAAARLLAPKEPDTPQLAVVVGLSTGREGIDNQLFGQATGERFRVLNLAASGGSFSEMRAYAAPLLHASIQPDLALVTVHASWLAGRPSNAHSRPMPMLLPAGISAATLHEHARTWWHWLEQQSWLLTNRVAVQAEFRDVLLAARARIELWRGQPIDAPVDPWAARTRYTDKHAATGFLAIQLREWEEAGWFDAKRMGGDANEAGVLREVLSRLQAQSPETVMVLMPEAEAFRVRVPERGIQTLKEIAAQMHPQIPVLDLRQAMPATAFRDQAHLNAEGRQLFTRLLAAQLMALHQRRTP